MIKGVVYTPEADADVATAYAWYEDRAPGLGEAFLRPNGIDRKEFEQYSAREMTRRLCAVFDRAVAESAASATVHATRHAD